MPSLSALNAYEGKEPDREKLLSQIEALVPLIRQRTWKYCQKSGNTTVVYFTYVYDTLNNYCGTIYKKAERVRDIRAQAKKEGIHLDTWNLDIFGKSRENNERFRKFIQDNAAKLGGSLVTRGSHHIWQKN